MISDVLSDAVREIEQYQRDSPESYADIAEEIKTVITVMDCLRVCLDMAPNQGEHLECFRRELLQAITATGADRLESARSRLLNGVARVWAESSKQS